MDNKRILLIAACAAFLLALAGGIWLSSKGIAQPGGRDAGPYTIEHRTVSEADCKDAMREGWTIVTSGAVDSAFAEAKPGGWLADPAPPQRRGNLGAAGADRGVDAKQV